MQKIKYTGLESRTKLGHELATQYAENNADPIIYLLGNHGSGKSFVVDNILEQLKDNKKMIKYITRGDEFIKYGSASTSKTVNSFSISAGSPLFSLGFGIGWDNNTSNYTYIRNLLRKVFVSDVLFCVDGLSQLDSRIRAIVSLIIHYIKKLQADFKVAINLLITDTTFIQIPFEDIKVYELVKYSKADIRQFLEAKHSLLPIQEDEIATIAELSDANLYLADFLYEEKINYGSNYLEAIEKVVNRRMDHLKESGKNENLNEFELEEVIFSASLSIKKFTVTILSEIVKQEASKVFCELNVAKEEELIIQDIEEYYDFLSYDIKRLLADKTIQKRKDWLLTYYIYYTENEQDEYYYRAYYLLKYQGRLTSASFSLLMLAYSAALEVMDVTKGAMIKEQLFHSNEQTYKQAFREIEELYHCLSANSSYEKVEKAYYAIQSDGFELPLKAELARAYFHYLYVNTPMNSPRSIFIMNQCKEYALNELYIDIPSVELKYSVDESVLRLRIIYDIAPCILDQMNQYSDFQLLYQKSKELTQKNLRSPRGRNMGLYIENVFNRKAFLFTNQMQCHVYYEKAKKYFKDKEIWDEYCITLVCEAGTDIVVQQYKEAINCCNKVLGICEEMDLKLPLVEKLYNNKTIAEFLLEEQTATSQSKRMTAARQAIKVLKELLTNHPSATEYVIITNICSLSLYCNNDRQYMSFKKRIEKMYVCHDISDINNYNIDDFYRYYFAWFELYRNIRDKHWDKAAEICDDLNGFVPALFQKQELFWDEKNAGVKRIITDRQTISSYDFCNNLVKNKRREQILSKFFHRGLMLSDIQYTSYI